MAKENNIDYHIKCVTYEDYIIKFSLHTKDATINKIFQKAKIKLARTKNIKITADPSGIEQFDIPPQYFKLLSVALRKQLKYVFNEAKEDGINIINTFVDHAKFKRNKENPSLWDIEVQYKGNYIDKR